MPRDSILCYRFASVNNSLFLLLNSPLRFALVPSQFHSRKHSQTPPPPRFPSSLAPRPSPTSFLAVIPVTHPHLPFPSTFSLHLLPPPSLSICLPVRLPSCVRPRSRASIRSTGLIIPPKTACQPYLPHSSFIFCHPSFLESLHSFSMKLLAFSTVLPLSFIHLLTMDPLLLHHRHRISVVPTMPIPPSLLNLSHSNKSNTTTWKRNNTTIPIKLI